MITKQCENQDQTDFEEEEAEAQGWQVTCPRSLVRYVNKPELDPGSWIQSFLLDHYGLRPYVTRVGQVRVLGGLALEDCVHSGPQMWPEHCS